MTTNPPNNITFTTRLQKSLGITRDAGRWEQLIMSLLQRLELDKVDRAKAIKQYELLADDIATKLDIPRHNVDVYSQGSMRTQTTIRPRGNAKFDIDIMVELSGPKYNNPNSEAMFEEFGKALEGNEEVTGDPDPRRRCWRLQYPGEAFYFDVTPAVADMYKTYGAGLRVRDPDTVWSPSNPKEFADWFCERADLRFSFQEKTALAAVVEARKSIDPVPSDPVGIDDMLRRAVQLMKLHRDNFYFYASPDQKNTMPISVIIVTLATQAFENIWRTRRHSFNSPIEVVLAIVEEMPDYIKRDAAGRFYVENPKLSTENFADRWNSDQGARAREFKRWHKQLETHLEALLTDEYSRSTEEKLRGVFGQAGVDAWRDSLGSSTESTPLLKSLVVASGGQVANPNVATPVSHRTNTLA
ncbi:nucleotidyltransferase domain-containing protein [Simplicispira sedimenti]|uniref:nucleotidyltransferase domain-containing protein n=1 Tax=Simplicispira sedimenti TaxID=2919500 RepID=UPI001FA95069|nr:nucleotidyltransferase [Acidovorax sp. W1-6]